MEQYLVSDATPLYVYLKQFLFPISWVLLLELFYL